MKMRCLACGAAAVMMLVLTGCGGDKKPPPEDVNTDVPVLDIDLGDDKDADADADADKGGDTDKAGDADKGGDTDKAGDADKGGDTPAPADSKPDNKPDAPAGGADASAPAGFGNLVIHFKADQYVESKTEPEAVGVCGAAVTLESLVIDKDTKALANVVGWYNDDDPKIHESYNEIKNGKVQLDNIKCRFEPNVAVLWTNQTLVIGNKDPFGHNSKVDAFDNKSINPVIPPGQTVEATFPNAESLPMAVSCNIHRWMKAHIVVKDHPLVGVSSADGTLTINNIEAGKHEFRFWHNSGYISKLKVNGSDAAWKKGKVELEIPDGGTLELNAEVPADSLQ